MYWRRTAWVATILCLPGGMAAGEDLLANPGFEEIDEETGFAAGWEPVYWSNPDGIIEASEIAHSGERSVLLDGLPAEEITDAGKRNNLLVAQDFGDRITGMRRLVLRGWVRTEGDGAARFSAFTYDAEGNRLQYQSSQFWTGVADWVEVAWTFTTEPETAKLIIYLRNSGEDRVWYDDMALSAAEDVLDSGVAQVLIDPLVGGRVRSFAPAESGREQTVWQGVQPGGMGAEIVPAERYPGPLRDAPYEATVLEPNRRVLLRREATHPDIAGLVIEKTYAMDEGSATLDVMLKVTNAGDEPREWAMRAQQCLPPLGGTFTWQDDQGLRVYRHPEHVLKTTIWIEDLAGDWIAQTGPESGGMVMQFDGERVAKALLYFAYDLQTIEWLYEPKTLAPGDVWETTYRIAAVSDAGPIVHAEPDIALSVDPLVFAAEQDYTLALHALGAEQAREVTVAGILGTGDREAFEDLLEARALDPAELDLPWAGLGVRGIEVELRAGDERAEVMLSQETVTDEPVRELPPPPATVAVSTGFFPYGEYYRGSQVADAGTEDFMARQLRTYRRGYLNTYIITERIPLNQFRESGESWLLETLRSMDMRLFPKGEFMRVFEEVDGDRREVFPGNYTREQAIERIESGGYDLDLRRAFADKYGDTVVAWDVSDEPGPEHIPNYMMIQSIFREIMPDIPAVTILNIQRTEFLPYMPIYYGDEYPIRNTGRRPWEVYDVVRFCATHTPAPVWVMLQAFGGLEGYSWYLPTGPEMRMMIYSVLAAGGKGITFHGSHSPPCWRHNLYYFFTSIDAWGAYTPAWTAMVEAGRQVSAIGSVMLDTEVDETEAFTVRCAQVETEGGYAGSAVRLGILRQPDAGGRFIVAVNQDITGPQQAELLADPELVAEDALLYDLFELAEIGPARREHAIALAAGDARIFFCGSPEAGAAVLDAVHGAHYRNEAPIYRLDASVAEANEIRLREADALAQQAAEAYEAGDGALAHQRIVEARQAVADAIAAHEPLAAVVAGLKETLELLAPVANTFREHFDVVVPPADREGVPRGQVWQNTRDARMQQYADETAQCFTARIALERRLHAGEAAVIADEVADLLDHARRLNDEATAYVLQKAGEAE